MKVFKSVGINPKQFLLKVVLSDGSSFYTKSTSIKGIMTLTKDTVNHPLWNPNSQVVDDQLGELSKFKKRFGDLDGLF
jgi:ribosomal protein L31